MPQPVRHYKKISCIVMNLCILSVTVTSPEIASKKLFPKDTAYLSIRHGEIKPVLTWKLNHYRLAFTVHDLHALEGEK